MFKIYSFEGQGTEIWSSICLLCGCRAQAPPYPLGLPHCKPWLNLQLLPADFLSWHSHKA